MRDTERGKRRGDKIHTQTHIAIQIFLDLRKDKGGRRGSSCSKRGRKKYARSIMEHKFVGEEGEKNCLPTPISHNAARRQKEERAFFVFGAGKSPLRKRSFKKEAATFYFRVLLLILCGKEKMTAAKKGGTSSISQGPPSNKRGTDRRVRARV